MPNDIDLYQIEDCPTCRGVGTIVDTMFDYRSCRRCNGSGTLLAWRRRCPECYREAVEVNEHRNRDGCGSLPGSLLDAHYRWGCTVHCTRYFTCAIGHRFDEPVVMRELPPLQPPSFTDYNWTAGQWYLPEEAYGEG